MPRPLTSAMTAQIAGAAINPCFFVQAHFLSGDVFLWSGLGTVSWNGQNWVGVGSLGSISPIQESSNVQANNLTLTMSGIPSDLIGKALSETRQGYAVQLWFGALLAFPNLLQYSAQFDQTAWANTNVTVTDNVIIGPGGLVTATKLQATASAATVLRQVVAGAGDNIYGDTYSIYVKKGSSATAANAFVLRNETTATNLQSITINYDTAAVLTGGSSQISVTPVGNGWLRVSMSAKTGISLGDSIAVYAGFNGGAATAGDFLYADCAQLVTGNKPRDYNATDSFAGAHIVANPLKCFAGRMDVPTVEEGGDTSTISITVESILVDLQRSRERRYTHEDQQIDYPGDLGFQYVVGLQTWNGVWGNQRGTGSGVIGPNNRPPRPTPGGNGGFGGLLS